MRDLPLRLAVAFGFLASLVFYTRLPGPFLTGPFLTILDSTIAPRPLIAFTLPIAALVIAAILPRVWKGDSESAAADPSVENTYRSLTLVVVLFVVGLHILLLAGISGAMWVRPWAGRGAIMLFGLLLIGAGNLLPRTRPNLAFGIRTRRTLADRNLWIQINRVGGNVAVAIGVVIVLAGALLTKPAMPAVINAAGLAGLAALVVSYRKHARA